MLICEQIIKSIDDSAIAGQSGQTVQSGLSVNSPAPSGSDTRSGSALEQTSSTLRSEYLPWMNAVFFAQKLQVTVDAFCALSAADRTGLPEHALLQQATDLTGGRFVRSFSRPPASGSGSVAPVGWEHEFFLQHLIWFFLPNTTVRFAV